MTFGQLRTFLAIVSTGSVRGAAERLFVTQPAVSAALASLQHELGVALVVREGRGLRVTSAGTVFGDYARRLVGLADEAALATKGEAGARTGRLRLAAVTTAGEHVLPPVLASFRTRHPHVGLVLEVGNRRRVWDLLDHHEVDLAIGGRPPASGRFHTLATRPNLLTVVGAPAGRRDRRNAAVRLPTLARATWLLREEGSGTRATAEEFLAELGIAPATLTVGSNGAIRESVRAGLGITLISRDAVARDLEEGTLVELHHGALPLQRAWHVAARADEGLPATASLFLHHLTDGSTARQPAPWLAAVGTTTATVVPRPGADSTRKRAPISSARSRMEASP